MTTTPDLIQAFNREILSEIGLPYSASDKEYQRLSGLVSERIVSRLFLELIASLTPEQAKLVATDINKTEPDPAETFQTLAKQLPDLGTRIAQILERLRPELISDLRSLAN